MIYKDYLFNKRIPLINSGLDAYAMRQKAIAKNISNTTTNGYVPEEVKFEELFNESVVTAPGITTNEKHISIGKIKENNVQAQFADANIPQPEQYFAGDSHVNVDKEMMELAETQIRFRLASKQMKSIFSGFQIAITGNVR